MASFTVFTQSRRLFLTFSLILVVVAFLAFGLRLAVLFYLGSGLAWAVFLFAACWLHLSCNACWFHFVYFDFCVAWPSYAVSFLLVAFARLLVELGLGLAVHRRFGVWRLFVTVFAQAILF